jgi:predicted transcriptional regulator YdeE
MLEVMIEDIAEFSIYGICTTTSHVEATSLASSTISEMWSDFQQRVSPLLDLGASIYSVYTNFRGPHNDVFDFALGATASDFMVQPAFDSVLVPGGKYLTFTRFGVMPEAADELWAYILTYFSYADCPYSRAFRTDFECYHSDHSLTVHISVEQFL